MPRALLGVLRIAPDVAQVVTALWYMVCGACCAVRVALCVLHTLRCAVLCTLYLMRCADLQKVLWRALCCVRYTLCDVCGLI